MSSAKWGFSRASPPDLRLLGFLIGQRQVELPAGATERVDLLLQPGIAFVMQLALPADEPRGQLELRGPSGELDFEVGLEAGDPFGSRYAPTLQPGAQTATLRCPNGHRYSSSFMVQRQQAAPGEKVQPFAPEWLRTH